LGVTGDQRVGTFCWNHQEHLECYLAIPSMGAVLHTLNIRLFPEQLTYVINHADDRVIVIDGSLIPLLCKIAGTLPNVTDFLIVGDGDRSMLAEAFPAIAIHEYAAVLAAESSVFDWPENLDEHDAAAMCYTSGTTGNPKGVAYSHRSTYLHSLASLGAPVLGVDEPDTLLVIVPMFHANAWGMPYSAFFCGADFVFPKQFLQAAPLASIIATTRPTITAAVPTIWNDLWNHGEQHSLDLSSVRSVTSGGSAVPRILMQRFKDKYGLQIMQRYQKNIWISMISLGASCPVLNYALSATKRRVKLHQPMERPSARLKCGGRGLPVRITLMRHRRNSVKAGSAPGTWAHLICAVIFASPTARKT
jgi:fatty-acyl-CoA synthase